MAWISVHEQVIGGKLRNTAKEMGCSQNEVLGMLVRFWLWSINNADREGRIIGADKRDIEEILAVGMDKSVEPSHAVDVLSSTGWIDIETDGLYIHDWEEWQAQWYKLLEVRAKDAARKKRERAEKRRIEAEQKSQTEKLPTPKLVIPNEKTEPPKYSTEFEDFWKAYPRKIGKGEAYKKYKARTNDGWSPEELKGAAENYANKVIRDKTETQYIKHAKTFLSDATPFTDFIPKPIKKKDGNEDPFADWR